MTSWSYGWRLVTRGWVALLFAILASPAAYAVDSAAINWSCSGGIPSRDSEVFRAKTTNCAKEVPGKGRLQKRVLWLYGDVDGRAAARVMRSINARNYQEVWLNSGGGAVREGLKIGRALRRHRVVLRVIRHPAVYCVSSCTIMTMGGYNRIIERDAEFIVHASSYFSEGVSKDQQRMFECADAMSTTCIEKRESLLRDFASEIQEVRHKNMQDTFTYFQTMLDGQPRRNVMSAVRVPGESIYASGAPLGRDIEQDLLLLMNGGAVAIQEIFTQFELRTARLLIEQAKQEIQRDPEPYGLGALESIRLHEAMFMCRIQDLCALQREQLLNVGYHNFDMADE